MKNLRKLLLFTALLVLLVGVAGASDVSDDTDTNTISDAIEAAQDTQTVSQIETSAQKEKADKRVSDKGQDITVNESATKNINKKNIKETNVKEEPEYASTWDELNNTITGATEDTTIILNNTETYKNTGKIILDRNIVITIDGQGHTIEGYQHNVFEIREGASLVLKNITISNTNSSGSVIFNSKGTLTIINSILSNNTSTSGGGVIYTYNGTINIINSTLSNNNATIDGGAAYNLKGTINIINSTLNNNIAAMGSGGAIFNYAGTVSITNSTLNNNNATRTGGAISNGYGTVKITNNSTLSNNNATRGGVISNIGFFDNEMAFYKLSDSVFTENHAINGAVIYCENEYMEGNITFNNFTRNTADNNETLYLNGTRTVSNNNYNSTDISLKKINLTVKENRESFQYGDNVELNMGIELNDSTNYDNDILTKLNNIIYINNQENTTTNSTNYVISDIKPGKYRTYYETCNQKSNEVSFIVIGDSKIDTDKKSYDYYEGVQNTIMLIITDESKEKGTIDVSVKDGEQYTQLSSYSNIENGSTISTQMIAEALENIYTNLNKSYTINITYYSECANPSSTEFTLNIIKQRNTTIVYDVINNTEGNVQITITVLDTVFRTPVPDARIEVTGNITINTTSGIITDTSLKQGECSIDVKFNQTDDYSQSETTIDFTVEIDKDKKITELEEEIQNLTDTINELLKVYDTTITINPVRASVGSTAVLSANVLDTNGSRVTGGKVVFKVNGKTLKDENGNTLYAMVNDGTASMEYNVLDVWMKNTSYVEAVYGGSENYTQSRAKSSEVLEITAGTVSLTLEENKITAKPGERITLRAKVLDANGDRITGDKVVFKLNGKSLKDENGNTLYARVVDGEAVLEYTIPATYSAKAYKLSVVYGSSYYERTEADGQLVLTKKLAYISKDSITTVDKKTIIKAKITDETGKLLVTSTKLAVKVNGKTILNGVNSTNGIIDVSFTSTLRQGTYEMIIISGENSIYKKATLTTVLEI